MKKPALLALLLVLGAWDAPAQASAPFVSRLQAKAGQSSVQLSWRTVPGFAGTHRIYRHTLEIDAATFPQAVQVGTVGAAAGAYEFRHTFAQPGWYEITFTVQNMAGAGEAPLALTAQREVVQAPGRIEQGHHSGRDRRATLITGGALMAAMMFVFML